MLKSKPVLIFVKTVFDMEKCLASRQGLSRLAALTLLAARCSKLNDFTGDLLYVNDIT